MQVTASFKFDSKSVWTRGLPDSYDAMLEGLTGQASLHLFDAHTIPGIIFQH